MKRQLRFPFYALFLFFGLLVSAVGWGQTTWTKLTNHSDVTPSGTYLIVETNGEFALTSINGTGSAPTAVPISISFDGNTIVGVIPAELQWSIEESPIGSGEYIIKPIDSPTTWLYSTATNNGVRVGTNAADKWLLDIIDPSIPSYKGFQHVGTTRFLGVFSSQDWRGYTTITTNIQNSNIEIFSLELTTNPILSATPTSISNLDYSENNGPSLSQSFDVSGLNLDPITGNITITAPSNFEVSLNNVDFSSSLNLPYVDGELDATTVYVRLESGLMIDSYYGNISINGGSADETFINVSGDVTPDFDAMEAFENFPETGSSYNSGDFLGVAGNTWNYINARGNIIINNETVTLQNNSAASLNSFINGGISEFSFDYMQAFGTNVNLEVYINGNIQAIVTSNGEQNIVKNSGLISLEEPIYGTFFIEFKQGSGGGQVAIDNFNWNEAIPFADYVWEDGAWFPSTPIGNSSDTDDLLIINGTAVLDDEVQFNNVLVLIDASLVIESILSVNGNIQNDGSLIFKSTSVENTAQLDTFNGTISGVGEVTVERFIPARRAFRFLSSSVTSSGSINANWQEGVNNPDTSTNLNPNPGFGTHITGSTAGENGFDATVSGNPSLFTLNNAAQSWVAVSNTDVNTIQAGTPYRLMVRGDRSVDVTSNTATPTNTVLRATGALFTGTYTTTDFNENEGASNFFGNPYPAAVNMNSVFAASTNINTNFFYVWDPNLNTRGAFVTVDMPDGTNANSSPANQYLQPGQAGFVRTLANGAASLTFQESHKAVDQPLTQVFNVDSKIDLKLFTASAFAQSESVADAIRIRFDEMGSNTLNAFDAPKFFNQDENLATVNDETLLSIESRALPVAGETIPLFINQYRTTDYVFEANLSEVNDIVALLVDHYNGTTTELIINENTLYAFEVDATIPATTATDRFEIVFEEVTMSTVENTFSNFVLFPNPAQGEINIASGNVTEQEVQLTITNVLGQTVYNHFHTLNSNGLFTLDTAPFGAGVYILKLTGNNGQQFTTKFIKK